MSARRASWRSGCKLGFLWSSTHIGGKERWGGLLDGLETRDVVGLILGYEPSSMHAILRMLGRDDNYSW